MPWPAVIPFSLSIITSAKLTEKKNIIIFGRELIEEDPKRQIERCITSGEDIAVINPDA